MTTSDQQVEATGRLPLPPSNPVQFRKQRRKIRRRRAWRKIRRWLMIFALGYLGYLFFAQPFWNIQTVDIKADAPEIQQWTEKILREQTIEGRHLLSVNPLALEWQLRQSPLAQDAQLRRWLFPARLEAYVIQRKPWARLYVADRPKPFIIDDTGLVLPLDARGLPVIPLTFRLDRLQGGAIDHNRLMAMHQLYDAYRVGALPAQGLYDLSNSRNLIWRNQSMVVWLGGNIDFPQKFAALGRLTPLATEHAKELEYIDVRLHMNPVLKLKKERLQQSKGHGN